MTGKPVALLIFVLSAVLICSSALADIITDDFNDGILHPMWHDYTTANGISVTETGGCLSVAGTTVPPFQTMWGNIFNDLFLASGTIEAQIKCKVPLASNMSGLGIVLYGDKGYAELQHNTAIGYGLLVQAPNRSEWSPWLPKKGNEATEFNLLKLTYDSAATVARAYVCDADGVNEQFVWSFDVELGDKVAFFINFWTQPDTTLDVKFDDCSLNAVPHPPVVPPPLALGVSLGTRELFQAGGGADLTLPQFSNNGAKLAFLRRDDPDPAKGIWNIYVKDLASDSPPYRVTEATDWVGVHQIFHWSPNDRRIFFITEPPGEFQRIRYVDATEATDRISLPYSNDFGNFTGIHFTRTTSPVQAVFLKNNNLFSIPVDDFGDPLVPIADAAQLTNFWYAGLHFPNISPDGTKIVAAHGLCPTALALWLIDLTKLEPGDTVADATHPAVTLLTDYSTFAATPYFSYDAKYIYFCKDMNNMFDAGRGGWNRFNPIDVMTGLADFDLCVVKADGSMPEARLTAEPAINEGILSASPDGTLLVYNSDEDIDGDGLKEGNLLIHSLVVGESLPPTGGEVADGSGTTVIVPDGALQEETTITITTPIPGSEPPLDTLPPGTSLALARDFGPDGITFAVPVTIEIRYTDEEVAALDEANLQIYYYHDSQALWVALPTLSHDMVNNIIAAETTHFSTFAALDVPYLMASVTMDPPSLNRKSKGKYITAYIELPAGFHPADISVANIRMNDSIAALSSPTNIGDHDGDGVADLMVKFDRTAVQDILPLGWAPVTISGQMNSGMSFEDNLSVYVFEKGLGHINEDKPDSIIQ